MSADRLKHIEKSAATPEAEMPDGLSTGEQLLFLTLRELYNNFRSGAVNRERGKREKQKILDAYRQVKLQEDLWEDTQKLRKRVQNEIGSLHLCDCPTCRKVGRVFDGLERNDVPEDIRELQMWNDKLRDLVKERSERAAALSTQLDRVRWILVGTGPAEEMIEKIKEVIAK